MKVYIAGKIAGDPEYERKFDNAAIFAGERRGNSPEPG